MPSSPVLFGAQGQWNQASSLAGSCNVDLTPGQTWAVDARWMRIVCFWSRVHAGTQRVLNNQTKVCRWITNEKNIFKASVPQLQEPAEPLNVSLSLNLMPWPQQKSFVRTVYEKCLVFKNDGLKSTNTAPSAFLGAWIHVACVRPLWQTLGSKLVYKMTDIIVKWFSLNIVIFCLLTKQVKLTLSTSISTALRTVWTIKLLTKYCLMLKWTDGSSDGFI